MKLSLQMTMVFGLVFALVCAGVAVNGFLSLDGITDATELADAKGFAWFWLLLACLGAAVAAAGRWVIRRDERADEGRDGSGDS